MHATTRETELAIRSIVTHALIGYEEVGHQDVDLIVDQCAALVAQATSPTLITVEASHLTLLRKHLQLLELVKEMRDTQVAYFASRKGRHGNRKILDYSKKLEGDLDRLVGEQLAHAETYVSVDLEADQRPKNSDSLTS